MASSASATQSLQGHRPRPTAKIVPVIPFSYMQKRKQNTAAPKKASDISVAIIPSENTATTTRTSTATPASSSPRISQSSVSDNAPLQFENAPADDLTIEEAATSKHPIASVVAPTASEIASRPKVELEAVAAVKENHSHQTSQQNSIVVDTLQPDGVKPILNMPQPFVLATNAQASEHTAEPHRHQLPVQRNHNTRSNNNSASYPGYPPDSSIESMPPYASQNQPQFGAFVRPHQVREVTDGSGAGNRHGPRMASREHDNVIRGMPQFGQSDSSSPVGAIPAIDYLRYPQEVYSASFHGSQSSIVNEANVMGSFPRSNSGYNLHVDGGQFPRPSQRAASQGFVHTVHPSNHHGPNHVSGIQDPHSTMDMEDELDGLVPYLLAQLGNSQSADYMLELRYTDDRAAPVRLNGHNLLFARSPTLKALINNDLQESRLPLRTLLLQSDDRFLHSGAFELAVQRLYGGPLLQHVPSSLGSIVSIPLSDRFGFAIGYAAAGHLLQMPPVVDRGIGIATLYVDWQTLQQAFDVAFDGGYRGIEMFLTHNEPQRSPLLFPTYGPAVCMLLQTCLNFMITSFPPNFELNTAVSVLPALAHIPGLSAVPSTKSRFSGIRFGDHSGDEEDPVRATYESPETILSRLLLALPFHLLQYVLESPRLGNVAGWATAVLRHKVMCAVVRERENRRLAAYSSKSVSDKMRLANESAWENVGWKESVFVVGPSTESRLQREWVGFLLSPER